MVGKSQHRRPDNKAYSLGASMIPILRASPSLEGSHHMIWTMKVHYSLGTWSRLSGLKLL